jgi:hypothetical protein
MTLRTITTGAVLAGIAVLLGGCGSPDPRHPAPTPTSRAATTAGAPPPPAVGWVHPPTQPGFDYTHPDQVCHRFGAALYSTDTTRDTGPADAYASATLGRQSTAATRDGRWPVWAAHRARIETRLIPVDATQPGADTALVAYRTVRISATAVGADGWRGPTEQVILDCTLARGGPDGPGWRVTRFALQSAGLP